MRKITKAESLAFRARARKLLDFVGATPNDDGSGYEFQVETRYGRLVISVYDDWVATCFDDPHRAQAVGAAPISGKWNFHGSDHFPMFENRLKEIVI